MPRALTLCNTKDCPTKIPQGAGRCGPCKAKAERKRRPDGSPYSTAGHRRFRRAVLDRDPVCVVCGVAVATVADHWPLSRVELVEQGLDPNGPEHGRGLCKLDHDRSTAQEQPGGWNVGLTWENR